MNDDKGGGEAAHRTARRVTMMTEITTPLTRVITVVTHAGVMIYMVSGDLEQAVKEH